jgi:chitinase
MSVGYFNGGGDVTAGPGGDIDKLDVRQITHLNYSFGLVYNDEKDETNDALKIQQAASDLAVAESTGDLQNPDIAPAEPEPESPAFRRRLGGARILRRSGDEGTRAVFIQSAQEIVEKYGLDGIDLDWEYPVNGAWGLVASQPADRDNFTAC